MIPLVKVGMPDKHILMPALEEVLYSGFLAEGDLVYQFEKEFASHFQLPLALGMSSGTAALHTSLTLAGVLAGDEVITTAMTAEPTNLAILHVGAVPVFADVDPLSGNMDPTSIEALISERTRAIMVVHYAGFPVRLNEIMEIANRHNIAVIEDCAHALGARYAGKSVGTIGDFGIYSFQAIKHMTTVDGGAITFSDPSNISAAKKFRWFGLEKGKARTDININSVGYKYNMNNVTGAIGLAQLKTIDKLIARHISNGQFFDRAVANIPGISATTFEPHAEPSYWLYTILSDDSDQIAQKLQSIGVMASKLHRPNHRHSIFQSTQRNLPGLESFYDRMMHIPCGWWVTDEDRERIVNALREG